MNFDQGILKRQFVLFIILVTAIFTTIIAQTPPIIKGRITTENNIPAPNTGVTLYHFGSMDTAAYTTTDQDGYFKLDSISFLDSTYESKFTMSFTPGTNTGYPFQYWSLPVSTVSPPDYPIYMRENIQFTVHAKITRTPDSTNYFNESLITGAIEGRLISETGNILQNTLVTLESPGDQRPVDTATTNTSGYFTLYNVPANLPHNLKFTPLATSGLPQQYFSHTGTTIIPVAEIKVSQYFTTVFNEIKLEANPDSGSVNTDFGNLQIRVNDSIGNALWGRCDIFLYNDFGLVQEYHRDDSSTIEVMTISQIPSGDNFYFLVNFNNYPQQYWNPEGNTSEPSHRFSVFPNQTNYCDVNMTTMLDNINTSNKISGKVTSQSNQSLSNIRIMAIRAEEIQWNPWISINNYISEYHTLSDSSGYYELNNLPWDEYVLMASTNNSNYQAIFFGDTKEPQKAKHFKIDNINNKIIIDFTMQPGAVIVGYVKNLLGNGIGKIRIDIWQHDVEMATSGFIYDTRTDINGKFILRGIPQGKWQINAFDEEGLYIPIWSTFEEVETQLNSTSILQNNIIMKKGGVLYGKYTFPGSDTSYMHQIGRLRIYPNILALINEQNFDDKNDTTNVDSIKNDDEWRHMYIGIHKNDSTGSYKTTGIPGGQWRMIFMPEPAWHLMEQSQNSQNAFFPSLRWCYIDKASSISTTKPITITKGQKIRFDLDLSLGGYTITGKIISGNNDFFGMSSSGVQGKYYHIQAYVKQDGYFIQISESYQREENTFILPGLVEGQQYYFRSWAEDYPDQWYKDLSSNPKDSSTCIKDSADFYTFATSAFKPVLIYMMKEPEGFNNWIDDDRPTAIKDLKIKTSGLSALSLNWSPSPTDENISHYVIYRLVNPTAEMFSLSSMHNSWEPTDENAIEAMLDSFIVQKTSFIDTSIDISNTYMYVVSAIDIKGREGQIDLPGNIPITDFFHRISYSDFQNKKILQPGNWQMIGACGLDSIAISKAQDPNSNTKLFYWDQTSEETKLYSHYVSVSALNPQKGAWLYTEDPIPVTMTENAFTALVKKSNTIAISLDSGWNQISSPFPYEVAPTFLSTGFLAWEWISEENRYADSKTFKPWKAYWIKSNKRDSIHVSKTPVSARRNDLQNSRLRAGWELKVSLLGNNSSDPDNIIGILPMKMKKLNQNRSPEPPQAFSYPQLYFIDNKEKLARHYIYSSFIPDKKLEWMVGVSPVAQKMDITISGISMVPEETGLFWINKSGCINLRKKNTIRIEPSTETQHMYIIATTNPMDIALYSGIFRLKNNYPNPFSKSTIIEFTIPYIWTSNGSKEESSSQNVSLSIYNVAGQLVSTIFSGSMKAGIYKKVWNGANTKGNNLPSGMYIARLQSRSYSKTIKLFKIQ